MKLLIAPLHYFANKVDGSEYTRSYEYLEYLSKDKSYSGDVLVAYTDINRVGNFNIHGFLKKKPTFISIPLRFVFIPWVFIKSIVLSYKTKYDCIWHQGPFAVYETFSLVSIFRNLLKHRPKILIGPIITPHSVRKVSGMAIIKKNEKGELVRHSFWNELDLFFYKKFSKTFSSLSRLTLRNADQVLAIDKTCKKMVTDQGVKNVSVLTLTLPENNFLSKPKSIGSKNPVQLLNVSYLVGRKRTEDLIEAINILVNNMHVNNIFLKIVGDGPEKVKLDGMVQKYNLGKYIKMEGLVERTKIHTYYKKADIFLSGSISDIMPGMYFEAMASSLPMVIAENVTSKEFRSNKFGGIVVKGKRPDLIANSILKIISDKKLYHKFSVRNHELINSTYNFKKGMEKLKQHFL